MFSFDSEEEELACKNLILAGEVCKNCGHNHKNSGENACNCVYGSPDTAIQCKCTTFEPFVSTLFDAFGNQIKPNQ
jgi:hypothetical protein